MAVELASVRNGGAWDPLVGTTHGARDRRSGRLLSYVSDPVSRFVTVHTSAGASSIEL